VRDDSGTRNANFLREFFASGPAIHNSTDPENKHTDYSSQDSGLKDFLNGILHIHKSGKSSFGISPLLQHATTPILPMAHSMDRHQVVFDFGIRCYRHFRLPVAFVRRLDVKKQDDDNGNTMRKPTRVRRRSRKSKNARTVTITKKVAITARRVLLGNGE
jgi:hypothetical protein